VRQKMITNAKGKFTRSIQHLEVELGSKNQLMQTYGENYADGIGEYSKRQATARDVEKSPHLVKGKEYWFVTMENFKEVTIDGNTKESEVRQFSDVLKSDHNSIKIKNMTKNELQLKLAEIQANATVEAARLSKEGQIEKSRNDKEGAVDSAMLSKQGRKYAADKEVKAANIATDPLMLDANERKAYELIKKTGILTDIAAFEVKLASGDQEAKKDAIELQKALKKDGKEILANGKLTNKTVEAAKDLIGENATAISAYEKVMNEFSEKSPGSGGTKPQSAEVIKQ
jgi:DNA-binding MarR family transcriptional regulator